LGEKKNVKKKEKKLRETARVFFFPGSHALLALLCEIFVTVGCN
jgi:hypothetical protein